MLTFIFTNSFRVRKTVMTQKERLFRGTAPTFSYSDDQVRLTYMHILSKSRLNVKNNLPKFVYFPLKNDFPSSMKAGSVIPCNIYDGTVPTYSSCSNCVGSPGIKTRPRDRLPACFKGMDAWMTWQMNVATWATSVLGLF